jgi:hypothetical protein
MDVEQHRTLAVETFNLTWDLLDKGDARTQEDVDRMIHAAHASRYHWGVAGTPLEAARGEWQISRVYAVLGRAEPARYHAHRSLDLCTANDYGGFDMAFALEAVARAAAIAGDGETCRAYIDRARVATTDIEDEDNRTYVEGELETIVCP